MNFIFISLPCSFPPLFPLRQLFYALLTTHVDELLPLVYTPTVGEACTYFSQIFTPRPKGMFVSISEKGNLLSLLQAWPNKNIKVNDFVSHHTPSSSSPISALPSSRIPRKLSPPLVHPIFVSL